MMKLWTSITETRQPPYQGQPEPPVKAAPHSPIRAEMTGVINISPVFISHINHDKVKLKQI